MGWLDDLFGFSETREKDAKAHAARNEALKKRREQKDEEEARKQARIMDEIGKINQQADNRKNGSWW